MTPRDEFVQGQVQPMLQPGEELRNMAHVLRAPSLLMQMVYAAVCFWLLFLQTKHYYAALTDRRVILLKTRSGLLRPKMVSDGVEEIDLASVADVSLGGIANNRSMTFRKRDGSEETLRIAPWGKLCSGQGRFMDDVQAAVRALPADAAQA